MDLSSSPSPEPNLADLEKLTPTGELHSMLNYKPPRLEGDRISSPSPLIPPLSFYDKHIDRSLALKRVRVLPTLLFGIPDTVDAVFETLGSQDIMRRFPFARYRQRWSRAIPDADSLAELLRTTSLSYCCTLACTMFLAPRTPLLSSVLVWTKCRPREYEEAWNASTVKGCLEINYTALPKFEENLKESVSQVLERFPEVAIWMINTVSDEAERLLKLMDSVAKSRSFNSQICLTRGFVPQPFHGKEIFDGRRAPWNIPVSIRETDGPWRNTRARDHKSPNGALDRSSRQGPLNMGRKTRLVAETKHDTSPIIYPPSNTKAKKCREDVYGIATPQHLLQHAWAEAVRQDTTVIFFSCGNYERIGIRHRKTQTLYLSQLFKPYRCKDPPYGKLYIGLYVAALEDAIDRATQQSEAEVNRGPLNVPEDHGPRYPKSVLPNEGPGSRTRKRRKIHTPRPAGTNSSYDLAILNEASKRELALIHLRYDVYNSSAPASFLRHKSSSNKPFYRPHEYITIVLTSYLGHGATGILHGGRMELETHDGHHLVYHVAVKLAFNPKQRRRLKREYAIYTHMEAANVKGIMNTVGLFRDMEGYTLALVMRHGGISLWDREIREGKETTGRATTVSPSERSAFLLAMKSIHDVGIKHRDIRPANLVVNDDTGEVGIIDFDRAHMNISEDYARYETEKLSCVLDAQYNNEEISRSSSYQASSESDEISDSESEQY